MVIHHWGDTDFDWEALRKAEQFIGKMYSRLTGLHPITKEKYGTLRYEMIDLWIKKDSHADLFCEVLLRACIKFPEVKKEIIDDAFDILFWDSTPRGYYYYRFKRILRGRE